MRCRIIVFALRDRLFLRQERYGGIAQLARAFGSYPKCHRFKSSRRYQGLFSGPAWRVGQAAKTPPFHGGNTGSIPVQVMQKADSPVWIVRFLFVLFSFAPTADMSTRHSPKNSFF